MTREEFVAGYMGRSDVTDYRVDGERVYFLGRCWLALPCRCGESRCEGWAMVPPSGREFHLFQNGIEGAPSFDGAVAADRATMEAEDAAIAMETRRAETPSGSVAKP